MRLWRKKLYNKRSDGLSPDEIFLDAANVSGFERERFEGVIERPISRGAYYSFASFLILFGLMLFSRTLWLQIVRGEELQKRSEQNYIEKRFIEPPRGIIYDRHGNAIVTNEAVEDTSGHIRYVRKVLDPYAFSHLIGFVGKLSEEDVKQGVQADGFSEIGKAGIEQRYNEVLRGIPGERDQELDALGNIISEGLLQSPTPGENITLSVDASLQEFLWKIINETATTYGFRGGAGIIFNVRDGSILSLVSVPSFNLDAFSLRLDHEEARKVFSDPRAPLYNRAVTGTFAPGSIVKPFLALGALEEGIIDPDRQLFSSGSISIPDPYRPGKASIFLDWKAHGYVNMRRALAVSSDVYFYTVGGGYGDVRGLGIEKIKLWLHRFGLDTPTGIDLESEGTGFLPDPEWKKQARPQNPIWRIGDTYNTSIGQGDILTTPLEIARALGALATHGMMLTPRILKDKAVPDPMHLAINDNNFAVVAEGMRQAAEEGGTAAGVGWVPFPLAAKTGTAEIGKRNRVNSWFMSYAPYENPQIGMVILMESGPSGNLIGATYVASETFRWILDHGGLDMFSN